MSVQSGDCRRNGLSTRPLLSIEARNYLCR
nr:MAG TPA: hypothetical protein [Caudoviricetes sp.]